jgi:hypothetical protein
MNGPDDGLIFQDRRWGNGWAGISINLFDMMRLKSNGYDLR